LAAGLRWGGEVLPYPLSAIRRSTSNGRGREWRGRWGRVQEGEGRKGKIEKRKGERGKEGAGGGRKRRDEAKVGREREGVGMGSWCPPHDLFAPRP